MVVRAEKVLEVLNSVLMRRVAAGPSGRRLCTWVEWKPRSCTDRLRSRERGVADVDAQEMNAVGAAGESADRETRRVDCLLCDANKEVGSVCRMADLLQVLLRIIYCNSSNGRREQEADVEYLRVSNSGVMWAFSRRVYRNLDNSLSHLFGCAGR